MENSGFQGLKELEGSTIQIVLPGFDKTKIQDAKLHRVEASGLWLELQPMTNDALNLIGQESSSHTLVIFVPWHGITMVLQSVKGVSLSEGSFGIG